jgi:putative MFS transporter
MKSDSNAVSQIDAKSKNKYRLLFSSTVIVSALGYFVDIYDLVLFSIVRVPSLLAIGVPESEILDVGVFLLNTQMLGMLVGGVLWGVIGDKKGRVSVLFGSILLYSVANILNGFVTNIPQYAILRFIAGVGLAGELGAAITLVSEILPKEIRGLGTTIVATVGVSGAVLAGLIGDVFEWSTAYFVGGGLGLLLLLLRVSTLESQMFSETKSKIIKRGDFMMVFTSKDRFKRYIASILYGTPIWFVIGILITFAPELARELGATEPILAGRAILFAYVGLTFGDMASGLLSHLWQSRKKTLFVFLTLTSIGILAYTQFRNLDSVQFYGICLFLGFAVGYWAVFVSAAAEQFGTNLRATVTTTTPNFVRGAVVPLTLAFQGLHSSLGMSLVSSALLVGGVTMLIAFYALHISKETYARDLDFIEH